MSPLMLTGHLLLLRPSAEHAVLMPHLGYAARPALAASTPELLHAVQQVVHEHGKLGVQGAAGGAGAQTGQAAGQPACHRVEGGRCSMRLLPLLRVWLMTWRGSAALPSFCHWSCWCTLLPLGGPLPLT